jgi:outer membrane protein
VTRASRPRPLPTSAFCLLTSSLFLLPGCKVDQAADVATYRAVLNASPTTRRAVPLAPDEPVSLLRAMNLANDHNETLSIQGESYLQALINKRRAVASFLPTVGGSAGYSLNGSGQPSNTFSFVGRTNDSLQVSVSEQINLFNGFRDVANYRRSEDVIRQRRWQLLDLQNSVLLDVANTYYNVLTAEQSVEVLRDSVALREQLIAQQTAQFEQGIARQLDVLQSQADAATTRVNLTRAINDVYNGRATLAFLTGVPAVEGVLADDLPDPPTDFDLDSLVRDAMATRQDLLAARAAIDAARENVTIAVGQYYPTVNLNLSQTLYRDPASPGNWAASLPVSVPIFTAGLIHQDVRTAWSQFRQAALAETQTERRVLQDVRVALFNLNASANRLRDIRYGVDAADNAYRVARRSYEVGTVNNLDVLTAQNQSLNARLNLVTEQLNYKIFYLQLLRAQGRLAIPTLPTSRPTTAPTTAPAPAPVAPLSTRPAAPAPAAP